MPLCVCDCVCVGVGVGVCVRVCAHTLVTNGLTFMTQGAAGKVIVLQHEDGYDIPWY